MLAIAITTATVIGGSVVADFATSIFAEYRLSSTVRRAAGLGSDPFVAIIAFPFIPEALRHRYSQLEIKANDVEHAEVGRATLEATMHSVDLTQASWLIRPSAPLAVKTLESRIIISSTRLGRYLGIPDLLVEAPPKEMDSATGGSTASGISGNHGLIFSGTPSAAHFDKRVSVSMDLAIAADDPATLVFTPTAVVTGPETADHAVPDDLRAAVLHAFAARLPGQRLPFAVSPTTVGVRDSDVIIEGVTSHATITLDEFKQS